MADRVGMSFRTFKPREEVCTDRLGKQYVSRYYDEPCIEECYSILSQTKVGDEATLVRVAPIDAERFCFFVFTTPEGREQLLDEVTDWVFNPAPNVTDYSRLRGHHAFMLTNRSWPPVRVFLPASFLAPFGSQVHLLDPVCDAIDAILKEEGVVK
jgi:hypothetical protein